MRLYALTLVKDEGDVIAQSIRHALGFCDRIYVLDNGSSDDTYAIVEELARSHRGSVIPFGIDASPFEDSMRGIMYDEIHSQLSADDWFFQLDADEFMLEDPRPAITHAAKRGFNRIRTWQAQFQFTDLDLRAWESGHDDREASIENRRNYFRVDWRESRLWRNDPRTRWGSDNRTNVPDFADRPAPNSLVNRHYQYRDPEQIQRRLALRAPIGAFTHVTTEDWRQRVVPAAQLRHWEPGEPLNPWPWRYFVRRARDILAPS